MKTRQYSIQKGLFLFQKILYNALYNVLKTSQHIQFYK